MAKFLCFGNDIKDPALFKASLITDIVLLSLITIFTFVHMFILKEPIVSLFFAFNLVFLLCSIGMLVWFLELEEVQTYQNYQYTFMRCGWNSISILVTAYLIGLCLFRVYGYANKPELIPIVVFYILYELALLFDMVLNAEVRRISASIFNAQDGSSYIESNNYEEKTHKNLEDNHIYSEKTGIVLKGSQNEYKQVNEKNYHVNDSMEFIQQKELNTNNSEQRRASGGKYNEFDESENVHQSEINNSHSYSSNNEAEQHSDTRLG